MDSLKKIVEIMEYLESQGGHGVQLSKLQEKFGENDVNKFVRYCLDPHNSYVHTNGGGYRLNPEGVRKLNDLKERLFMIESKEKQNQTNELIAYTGCIIALTMFYNFFSDLGILTDKVSLVITIPLFVIIILLVCLIIKKLFT